MGLKVKVAGKQHEISDDQKNIMEYFNEAEAIQKIKGEQAIEITTIDEPTWKAVIELCTLVNNKFPEIAKVKGNDLKQAIGSDLSGALGNRPMTQINSLFRAAHFLKIAGLRKSIAATLACKIYVKPTLNDFKKKMQELGVKQELTAEKSKKMKQTYPFMN